MPATIYADKETELVLECVRTFLVPERSAKLRSTIAESVDWNTVQQRAEQHSVMPVVASVLTQYAGGIVPDQMAQTFRGRLRDVACRNLFWVGEWQRLLSAFDESKISLITFKGPAVALVAYRDISLREFADLDFLVRPDDVVGAKRVLELLGYSLWSPVLGTTGSALLQSQNRQLRFVNYARHTVVDLHWGLLHEMFPFQLNVDSVFQDARVTCCSQTTFLSLSPEHSLLYSCAHATKDCWSCLSELCDVGALVALGPSIEWEKIYGSNGDSQCGRLLKHSLLLVERVLGVPLPAATKHWCDSDSSSAALSFTAETFLCLDGGARPGYWKSLRYYSAFANTWSDRGRLVFKRVFAPAEPDWQFVALPTGLRFLYFFIRPLRFLGNLVLNKPARSAD